MKTSLMEDIKRICDEAVAKDELAGLNVLVLQNGREAAYYEAGCIDKEAELPLKRDSIFRLYSMSKPITACAAMILMERGMLSLCEPVGKYIPEFMETEVITEDGTRPAMRPIEIRDLLSMTSGIPYNHDGNASGKAIDKLIKDLEKTVDTEKQMSTVAFAKALAGCPFEFDPSTKWQYGLSADVMGAIIEIVSGMKFGEFLKKEIFEPLHMNDTGFYVPEDAKDRLSKTYRVTNGVIKEDPTVNLGISYTMKKAPQFESGGAGLVSTIDDYKRFALMLLNGGKYGETRILSRKTAEHMCSSMIPLTMETGWDSMKGYGYGNFMRVCEIPGYAYDLACKGEYGWDGWLGCYFTNLPEEKITILSMQQRCDWGTNFITRRLRNVILSHLT